MIEDSKFGKILDFYLTYASYCFIVVIQYNLQTSGLKVMTSDINERAYCQFSGLDDSSGRCEAIFSIFIKSETSTVQTKEKIRLDMAYVACQNFDRHRINSGLMPLRRTFNTPFEAYYSWWSGPRIALLVASLAEGPKNFMEIQSILRSLIAVPEDDLQEMLKTKGVRADGYEGQFISGGLSNLLTQYTNLGLPCAANDEYYKSPETHTYMQLFGAAWMEDRANPLQDAYKKWVATRKNVDRSGYGVGQLYARGLAYC